MPARWSVRVADNSQIYEVPNAIKEAGKKIAILQ